MGRSGDNAGTRHPLGFTLVEMLIVVVILGIVLGITIPRLDIDRYRVESAMQSVGTTLLAAQRLAVTRGHDIMIRFDPVTNAFQLHEDGNNDGTIDAGERTRRTTLGEQVVFGRAGAPALPFGNATISFTQVDNGLPVLTFHRNGSASEAGGIYLTGYRAQARGEAVGRSRAIEIERATGRTSWYKYTSNGWARGF